MVCCQLQEKRATPHNVDKLARRAGCGGGKEDLQGRFVPVMAVSAVMQVGVSDPAGPKSRIDAAMVIRAR